MRRLARRAAPPPPLCSRAGGRAASNASTAPSPVKNGPAAALPFDEHFLTRASDLTVVVRTPFSLRLASLLPMLRQQLELTLNSMVAALFNVRNVLRAALGFSKLNELREEKCQSDTALQCSRHGLVFY